MFHGACDGVLDYIQPIQTLIYTADNLHLKSNNLHLAADNLHLAHTITGSTKHLWITAHEKKDGTTLPKSHLSWSLLQTESQDDICLFLHVLYCFSMAETKIKAKILLLSSRSWTTSRRWNGSGWRWFRWGRARCTSPDHHYHRWRRCETPEHANHREITSRGAKPCRLL